MATLNDYAHALKEITGQDKAELALVHLQIARDFLSNERRRKLEQSVSNNERVRLLDQWFGDFIAKEVKHTIALMAEANDVNMLDTLHTKETSEKVTLVMAREPDPSFKESIIQEVEGLFPNHPIAFRYDKSLIGGIKIKFGDREVDNSISKKLALFRDQ